jgi:DNA-binding transcriptional ArsR family regulator
MATRRRAATRDEARALAHPLRLRIIRLLFDQSLTNKELAERLDEQPATVLYHVRTLLRTGFIAPDGDRPGPRGTTEKPYRSTGKSWTLDVSEAERGRPVSRAAVQAFLGELDEAGAKADLHTTRLAIRVSKKRLAEVEARLGDLLDELADSPDDDGEPWSIFLALHRRR